MTARQPPGHLAAAMWRTARPSAPTLLARRGKTSATHQPAARPDRRPLLAGGVLCLADVAPLPAASQTQPPPRLRRRGCHRRRADATRVRLVSARPA